MQRCEREIRVGNREAGENPAQLSLLCLVKPSVRIPPLQWSAGLDNEAVQPIGTAMVFFAESIRVAFVCFRISCAFFVYPKRAFLFSGR